MKLIHTEDFKPETGPSGCLARLTIPWLAGLEVDAITSLTMTKKYEVAHQGMIMGTEDEK